MPSSPGPLGVPSPPSRGDPQRSGGGTAPEPAEETASNLNSVTPVSPPMFSIPTTRTVLKAGWVTGVTSTIVCLCIRALAWIFRVPFEVKPLVGSGPLQSVPWLLVFAVPLAAGMIVSLVAAIFLGVRRAAGWVTTLGTLAFLGLVYLALSQPPAVLWSTRIWLAVMIVLTWLIVVPQVARVVGDGDPKLAAAYRTLPSPEVTPGA